MGKGSNVSKANRSRELAAKRAKEEGKGGGGKEGMSVRKDSNVADKIAAAQVERAKIQAVRDEKKAKEQKEAQEIALKIAKTAGSKKKNDLSLLDGY